MRILKNVLIFTSGMFILTVVFVLSSYTDKNYKKNTQEDTDPSAIQQIKVPKLPDTLNFAGEPVPLSDFDVHERIDREFLSICFGHSTIIQNIKFTKRYFPIMEEVFKKYGIPDDFKYLAVTESNLRNLTSSAGAKGIWQFMSTTAQGYNLLVTKEVDERMNFYKTTEAACKLLKNLKEKFGSWTVAAAAYNCGEGRVKEKMNEQLATDYYQMVLPDETMRYVPRIIAMKEVMKDPAKYGLNLSEKDFYPELPKYKKISVNTSVKHWPEFCKQYNISYKTLIVHNPWITAYTLTNTALKTFEVLIPEN